MITDKRIGVLAGGLSAEREVSLRSGNAIHKALLERGYDAVFIDAAKDIYTAIVENNVEIAFIALHGGHGENGSLQGFLEVIGVPYTGSGVLASAVAMDKAASKKIFMYHGIPVPSFKIIHRKELPEEMDASVARILLGGSMIDFDMPWVVKPSTEGSSIGVHIVKNKEDLLPALNDAFKYGEEVIIERFVKGREIQIGVLGDRVLGGVEVRPSLEFYSYEAKYTPGLTSYILPPDVSEHEYDMLKSTALRANKALGCAGATRIDMILAEEKAYMLEVNTIPGMTETSLLPKIAGLAGYGFADLVEEILKSACGK
ncbi:MAG TPA: D-alanine--D-alanine ligase [Dissulfurispiraceae bacterium]|nr:D-alanine--D-alanine ligase [Dissulfurispiraceae bacterium]